MRKLTGEKLEAELARLEGMRAYEHQYESAGIVCGIDEAGRGPLAGPVVAAVAVLPKDCTILRLNDSKKLSEKCREELFLEIKEKAAAYGIGIRHALMRLIFCRRPMKQCVRQSHSFRRSRISF